MKMSVFKEKPFDHLKRKTGEAFDQSIKDNWYIAREYVLDKLKDNFVDSHVSYVYEDICREDVWGLLPSGISVNRVGRWWGSKDIEIDIVAYDSSGTDMVFGECKYSKQKKGLEVLRSLQEKSRSVAWKKDTRNEYFVIYSKSGFTADLVEYADQHNNIFLKEL